MTEYEILKKITSAVRSVGRGFERLLDSKIDMGREIYEVTWEGDDTDITLCDYQYTYNRTKTMNHRDKKRIIKHYIRRLCNLQSVIQTRIDKLQDVLNSL
jgi:hypothetical protein